MIIDRSKLNKIGIDRVVLNNFKISNFDKLEKKEVVTNLNIEEKLERKSSLITLNYSLNLKYDNQMYLVSTLEFNPNRILNNHNIYNSSVLDLKKVIEIIILSLAKEGIELDLSEAKIKEIEINYTYLKDFEELEDVLLLIGRANYEKSLSLSSFRKEDIPSKIKFDRSLYINSKTPDYTKEITGKVIKFYDKTFELSKNYKIYLSEKLTRIEVLLGRDYYRSKVALLGLTNDLKDLLENKEIIKTLYINALQKELKEKPLKYLEVLKKNLAYDFVSFKRNEKKKKKERDKLMEIGKEIPLIYREQRGIYEYLSKESWIFDYTFLLNVIADKVEVNNKKREFEKVIKKYSYINNYTKYKELIEIFFTL